MVKIMLTNKIAVFDFDGTLVDSMPVWAEKMLRLLKMQGITPPSDIVPIIATLGDLGTLDYFQKHFKLTMTRQEMLTEMDNYALPKYTNEIPLKSGVYQFLQKLYDNKVKIYLLTASPRKMFAPALSRLGIDKFFTKTWSSDEFNLPKSNPQIYVNLANLLGVNPSQITFYDDNKNAIISAKKANLTTVAVHDKTNEQDLSFKTVTHFYVDDFAKFI